MKFDKPTIIIADPDYFPLLLKYKDPKANIKFMPIAEAITNLSFEVTPNQIAPLLDEVGNWNGCEYNKAKQILRNLQLIPKSKYKDLPEYLAKAYNSIKLYLKHNYDRSQIFKNKDLYLFNMDKDIELTNLFASHKLKLKKISFKDYGIEEVSKPDKVYAFENKLEQYMYVFADIRTRILKDPSIKDNIRIIVKDQDDALYVDWMSHVFGIDYSLDKSVPLYNFPYISKSLKEIYKARRIDLTKLDLNPAMLDLIDAYRIHSIYNFDKAYLNLFEILTSTRVSGNPDFVKGVYVTNKTTFNDKLTYILDFQDDEFYKFGSDTDVISDSQKKELGINPSYIKTLNDKQKKLSFVKYNKVVLLSRVKQHLNEHIYKSGLLPDLNIENETPFDYSTPQNLAILNSFAYTTAATSLFAAIMQDKGFDVSAYKEVSSYSNQPVGLNIKIKDHYSISDIQEYKQCPFKYLLDKEAKLLSQDDKYYAQLGTLLHSVLEHIKDKNFDYDKLYDDGIEVFKKSMDEKGQWQPKYAIFLQITKKWFKRIVEAYRVGLNGLPNVSIDAEVVFNFTIPETDYKFKGIIDCLMISKYKDKKYFSIVDYKTGSDEFNPIAVCVGQNIQLPMYFSGITKSDQKDKVKDCIPGGFGLKLVLGNSPKKFADDKYFYTFDTLNSYTMAYLTTSADDDYDKSLGMGDDQLVQIATYGDNSKKTGGQTFEYDINLLCKQAEKVVIDAISSIQSNQFPVTITANTKNLLTSRYELTKRDTNCQYCAFADICYKSLKKDYNDQSKTILAAFGKEF